VGLKWPFPGRVQLSDSLEGWAAGVVLGWCFCLCILMAKRTWCYTHPPNVVLGWGMCNTGQQHHCWSVEPNGLCQWNFMV
jgi:hypothetical protein